MEVDHTPPQPKAVPEWPQPAFFLLCGLASTALATHLLRENLDFGRHPSAWLVPLLGLLASFGLGQLAWRETQARRRAAQAGQALAALDQKFQAHQAQSATLVQSQQQLEAFSHTVAHDLRAPLRAIEGFAHALLADHQAALSQEGREHLDRIMTSASHLDRLIRDLLAYSQLSRADAAFAPADLSQLARAAIASHSRAIAERRATVHCHLPPIQIRTHPATLEHALSNLIGNALKFTAPGREPLVEISADDRADAVRLSVRDHGLGIAPEHHQRIFGLFERLHSEQEFPGTGLGLAIVKQSVERMGGTVGLTSTPGQGSTFWIELPKSELPKAS